MARLALILIIYINFSTFTLADRLLLPLELTIFAKKNSCKAIDDFYNRPGMVEPSYVYGYLKGEKENSAIFWCRSINDKNKYKLVIYSRIGKYSECSNVINSQNYPGGLSLIKNMNFLLSDFTYLDNNKHGPDIKVIKDNFIRSYYDGVEEIFYCHKRRWLKLIRD